MCKILQGVMGSMSYKEVEIAPYSFRAMLIYATLFYIMLDHAKS